MQDIPTFTCDEHGTTISMKDIRVTIPPGAVPEGVVINIEVNVTLYGPFKFGDKHQQVSPILWFCLRDKVELLLPIEFQLPHVITNTSRVKLSFAKANHSESYDSVMKRKVFSFKAFTGEKSRFTNCDLSRKTSGYGVLSTKHHCFFCIQAEISKSLALEKGYCLHTLKQRMNPSSYKILLVCTYFLETCFDVSSIITG